MEMNPLLLFKNNCWGKQSVSNCLLYLEKYVGKKIVGKDITNTNKINLDEKGIDIWYGVKDSKKLDKFIPKKSVSFVLTDPPYGGLVQYLDLSTVWLSWLELINKKYSPIYENEITINKNKQIIDYQRDMQQVLKSLHSVIKNDARVVLTFNNKNLAIWHSLLSAINLANFEITKVLHQQNMRSGESQVKDKYGTSSCDFYIRCQKRTASTIKQSTDLETFVLEKTKMLITKRGEPIPYKILFNGILAEISLASNRISSFDGNIREILNKALEKEFEIIDNTISFAGDY
jgi:tRNA G10  N-methylase Trm11